MRATSSRGLIVLSLRLPPVAGCSMRRSPRVRAALRATLTQTVSGGLNWSVDHEAGRCGGAIRSPNLYLPGACREVHIVCENRCDALNRDPCRRLLIACAGPRDAEPNRACGRERTADNLATEVDPVRRLRIPGQGGYRRRSALDDEQTRHCRRRSTWVLHFHIRSNLSSILGIDDQAALRRIRSPVVAKGGPAWSRRVQRCPVSERN